MDDSIRQEVMRKVIWRLVPFTMFLYLINILDRVNIGYAALQMNKELHIMPAAFGALAAAFFIGYFFFEVPSNMILEKVGVRQMDRPDHGDLGHRHEPGFLRPGILALIRFAAASRHHGGRLLPRDSFLLHPVVPRQGARPGDVSLFCRG